MFRFLLPGPLAFLVRRGPRRRAVSGARLAGLLARSVERDTLLLLRLPREQARRLAASIGDGRTHPTGLIEAARRFTSIDAILGDMDPGFRPGGAASPQAIPPRRRLLGRLLAELALERTGVEGLAVLAAVELGASELLACPPPFRQALVATAVREIASAQGDATRPPSLPDALCRRALLSIGEALRRDDALPLARAARGDRAATAAGAIREWRDLSCCRALLGPDAHGLWRRASAAAAFACVWALPDTLDALPPGDASRLRADAARAARTVLRTGRDEPAAAAARAVLVSCDAFVDA